MRVMRIDVPMYEQVIYFSDSLEKSEKRMRRDGLQPEDYESGGQGSCHGLVKYAGNPEKNVWIKHVVVTKGSVNTLAHETFHCVASVMRDISCGDILEEQEPSAYLMGYLFEKLYNHMKAENG